jgi:hypothetical protein
MSEVKGRVLKSIQKYIQKKFGKEEFDRWLDAISVEAYTIYAQPIDVNEWYPIKTALIDPMANVAQLFYKWDLKEAAWEFGRYAVDFGLKGPYKALVRITSAKTMIHKAGDLLATYYRPCNAEVEKYEEGHALVRIKEFPEVDKTTEYRIAGWVQRGLEINGCKNVNVEITRSLTTFDPYTEYKITWETK